MVVSSKEYPQRRCLDDPTHSARPISTLLKPSGDSLTDVNTANRPNAYLNITLPTFPIQPSCCLSSRNQQARAKSSRRSLCDVAPQSYLHRVCNFSRPSLPVILHLHQ